MNRRIRDKLQIAGASDEYIMSRMVDVSIHKPTDEERRKGRLRRRFFAGPHDYIEESLEHLRAVARCLDMEEPSLMSIEHSIDMVFLHWVRHDDVQVWRAPAESAAIGLMTTFFPEVLRVEVIHLYDEDTAGKVSYRPQLEASPLPAAMRDSFTAEWQETWGVSHEAPVHQAGAQLSHQGPGLTAGKKIGSSRARSARHHLSGTQLVDFRSYLRPGAAFNASRVVSSVR
jgi:hypothetical protein